MIGGRYSTNNIFALQELAAWLLKHEPDLAAAVEAEGYYAWAESWLENDRRNGGDPWVRRQMRGDWPAIRDEFMEDLMKQDRWLAVRDRAGIALKLAVARASTS